MDCVDFELFSRKFIPLLLVIYCLPLGTGVTDSRDVAAMNNLYRMLDSPPLDGWNLVGGDPCGDEWQGVLCVFTNITGLDLSGANLGGKLGDSLDFASILTIDLSNNHIGGSIPAHLPPTLTALSLGNNNLSGVIPDFFEELTTLITLDLSANKLSGPLPPSFGNLSSLSILNLQNNTLVGTLNVIEDLPLVDLNIENNLFSGPIPPNLLAVPIFRKEGNPFNTSVILPPSPAPSPHSANARSPYLADTPSPPSPPKDKPGKQQAPPPLNPNSSSAPSSGSFKMGRVLVIGVVGILLLIAVIGLCLLLHKRRNAKSSESLRDLNIQIEKAPRDSFFKPSIKKGAAHDIVGPSTGQLDEYKTDVPKMTSSSMLKDQRVDINRRVLGFMPLPPSCPSSTFLPVICAGTDARKQSSGVADSSNSLKCYNIATLQQRTDSFSQESFLGEGMLGSVYRAELPDGKTVAVKKLEHTVSERLSIADFRRLLASISKLQHQNVLKLIGYCPDHGQRILVYHYCQYGTLYDALHMDEEIHIKLSWNARIRIALEAARALEYLHELCSPPVVHRNFKSANILLDKELEVRVSDCGLASLVSFGSTSQLSEQFITAYGYAAPEVELGAYTCQSDVYSFGVVMLELLTGRKALDRTRPRVEQFLVRWAASQLHDINALSKMVDPSLKGLYSAKSLSRFADIISRCLQTEAEFRPQISEVVQDLSRVA